MHRRPRRAWGSAPVPHEVPDVGLEIPPRPIGRLGRAAGETLRGQSLDEGPPNVGGMARTSMTRSRSPSVKRQSSPTPSSTSPPARTGAPPTRSRRSPTRRSREGRRTQGRRNQGRRKRWRRRALTIHNRRSSRGGGLLLRLGLVRGLALHGLRAAPRRCRAGGGASYRRSRRSSGSMATNSSRCRSRVSFSADDHLVGERWAPPQRLLHHLVHDAELERDRRWSGAARARRPRPARRPSRGSQRSPRAR